MKRALLSTLGGMAGIVAVGAGVGLVANAWRADGLPLGASPVDEGAGGAAACSSAAPASQVPHVTVAEAGPLHGRAGVTFVDARPEADFRRGHIRGAIHLPYEAAAEAAGKSSLPVPRDHRLIVYCEGGAHCQLSELLAQVLSRAGCEKVRVLKGGYPAWVQAGLPVE